MKPYFSILIPVYNAENYLRKCVNSILTQTIQDFELILLDDGSTDGSYDICEEYNEKHSCVRVIHQENAGPLLARKKLVEQSEGEYCIFADADDYLDSSFLREIKVVLERHLKCDMLCFGSFRVFENAVYPEELLYESEEVFRGNSKKQLYELAIQKSGLFSVWAKAFRRELIVTEEYQAYGNIRYGEDRIQVMQMLLQAKEVVYVPYRLYYYRATEGSLTQRVEIKRFENMYAYTDALEEFMKKAGIYTKTNCQMAYTSLMKDFLDSLLKYNTSEKTLQEKRQGLYLIRQMPYYKILQKESNVKELPIYHKVRYRLLNNKYDKVLIALDGVLFLIKNQLKRRRLFKKVG